MRHLQAQDRHPGALVVTETRPTQRNVELLGLTPREAETVTMALAGATNLEISRRAGIAPGTVNKHLDNVYAKLGVGGRRQLVALVLGVLSGASSPTR